MAAAVVFDYSRVPARALAGIDDSKALTCARREELYGRILTAADRVSVVTVSAGTIDARGLHRCNLAALAQALDGLAGAYDLALIDGFDVCRPDLRAQAVVGGDGKSAAVGAASIVAKVVRDRLMRGLDARHPEYGFAQHVGYGTRRPPRGSADARSERPASPQFRRSGRPPVGVPGGRGVDCPPAGVLPAARNHRLVHLDLHHLGAQLPRLGQVHLTRRARGQVGALAHPRGHLLVGFARTGHGPAVERDHGQEPGKLAHLDHVTVGQRSAPPARPDSP